MPVNPKRMPTSASETIRRLSMTHTSSEIAAVLGVHRNTVILWAREIGVRCARRSTTDRIRAHAARVRWIFDLA